jgi:tetratricopeptide (TPR) repeat protein
MVHSSLGNDYEAMGKLDKAVEEYKLALLSQPESFELNYNIGCCLYDELNFSEALKHYEAFLRLVEKEASITMDTKALYVADCLISMASCRNELEQDKMKTYDDYLKAWKSVKDVKELSA